LPESQCAQRFEAIKRRHPGAIVRKGVIGGYNCAGLVWASRRAVVPNPRDWETILIEDGYRLIPDSEADIGDIVVDRDAADLNQILHVGRICKMDALFVAGLERGNSRGIFMVLSKLDLTLGELIHRKDDIHFFGSSPFVSQVYTDR
jgi:hypothetical protein